MKIEQKILLSLGLFVGSIYAQDTSNKIHSSGYIKDYNVKIKSKEPLKQGYNKVNIKFTHKGHTHNDLKSNFTVYSPSDIILSYKGENTKINGQYLYNINLQEKGIYTYVLTFGQKIGVRRTKRGSFKL
jgi:hypothetical protein